ncbi:MAG: phage integrase N-terminal SAM-like domain-containing protein [Leptolyngbyaceae cyanobacterium]
MHSSIAIAIDRNVAVSTQTVALSALLFLYRQVLNIELPYIDDIERARRPQRLPVVFTRSSETYSKYLASRSPG